MIERHGAVYVPVCDGCGKKLEEEYSFRDAVAVLKAAGWKTESTYGFFTHLCPECAGRCDFER